MAEFLDGCDEVAVPSRGDCSSLPEIDFAKEAAFTCWMTVQRKFISQFSERLLYL
jgi:hypothetical protein